MAFREDDEQEDEDIFGNVSRMADRLGLKGEKRANYIDDHMVQLGYERVQTRESYARPQEPDGDDGGTSRWGFGGRTRPSSARQNRDEDRDF